MSESAAAAAELRRRWRWAAWVWLALVLALAAHQLQFWSAPKLDSDLLTLLPREQADPVLAAATERISDAATRSIVVVLSGPSWATTLSAAHAFVAALQTESAGLLPVGAAEHGAATLAFYRPYRDRLLTPSQRASLRQPDPAALADRALANLYGPGVTGGATAWQADPLALWPDWWQQRIGSGISERDGMASIAAAGSDWIILSYESPAAAFKFNGKAPIQRALDRASAQARALVPTVKILRAGVPLHAEAAAARANWEMNTIGLGSFLAVILLMWLAFRGLRPLALVALSLAIGWAAGVSVTALVFGKVHLLTLVFGASLVGVAEDYGIHYFASRQRHRDLGSHGLMYYLLPGLTLAFVTSALAYLALAAAPFPGLRQMAVFSTAGLMAAFATVACWFPWLDQRPRPISRFGNAIAASLQAWPRLPNRQRFTWLLAVALLVFTLLGLQRIQIHDDLRSLQKSPVALVRQQQQIDQLLGLPSPAQFYLVRGASVEQVLQREEALTAKLDQLVSQQQLKGYRATSDWVPSLARQHADAGLTAAAESSVLTKVSGVVGETITRPAFAATDLTLEDWLRQPLSAPFRSRWLGAVGTDWASVVMLNGVGPGADLGLLSAQAKTIPGVRWIDRTSDISRLLGHYRAMMAWLLVAGFAGVVLVLALRYRRLAWRALLPTAVAGVVTVAALAWLGEPFDLFSVLALLMLLGMGIDYGIFLLEHDGDGASWLAVCLGAASTLLAFGLLALSATPALRTFGLTLLFGIGLVWLLSPLFRPPPALSNAAIRSTPLPSQTNHEN